MASHPPIPISELADHTERLKANDNLKFSQEYEVWILIIYPENLRLGFDVAPHIYNWLLIFFYYFSGEYCRFAVDLVSTVKLNFDPSS